MSETDKTLQRILIVEDEAVTAMDLASELRRLGYEVCGMEDSAEGAVAAVEKGKPGLVLMDIRLGDNGDGVEAARRIAERHDAAVVFLTAHSDEQTLARALAAQQEAQAREAAGEAAARARFEQIAREANAAKAARHAQEEEASMKEIARLQNEEQQIIANAELARSLQEAGRRRLTRRRGSRMLKRRSRRRL